LPETKRSTAGSQSGVAEYSSFLANYPIPFGISPTFRGTVVPSSSESSSYEDITTLLNVMDQVREENPIFVQSQNTTKHKTKFITTLQHVSA